MTVTLSSLPPFVVEFIKRKMRENGCDSPEALVVALLEREAAKSDPQQLATDDQVHSGDELRERLKNIQEDLHRKGLLAAIKSSEQVSDLASFEPIEIDGPPLSQTVIEDRR